jgi:hypothetical protein
MRVILRWTCPPAGDGVDVRLARFRRVLRAAQRTSGYQPFLESAGLATPEALASVDSVEGTLERLPAIDLSEFCGSRSAFESPGGLQPTPQTFRSPLEHTPKTAILMSGFQSASGIKVMAQNWNQGLKRFGASALAAPVGVLRSLAEAVEAGDQPAPSLRHFVVSFTGGEQGELVEDDRERFWRVFQVPVFEQRLGFDGRVIAYECEAHQGLHIVPERAAIEETAYSELLLTSLTDLRRPTLRVGTRLAGAIQHDCCDCGNAASRLIGARPLLTPQPLAAAAC